MRITKENDPISRELTAYHVQFFRAPDRPIYMDGRPHPPNGRRTPGQASRPAKFDGNTLVITTTHLKESYIRANTALFSEKSKVTEFLTLDGDILTVTTLLEDPVYMEEPHVQSISYRRNVHQELPFFPCTVGVENVAGRLPALPARQESVHRRCGEEAGAAARSDQGRRRDDVSRVPREAEDPARARGDAK